MSSFSFFFSFFSCNFVGFKFSSMLSSIMMMMMRWCLYGCDVSITKASNNIVIRLIRSRTRKKRTNLVSVWMHRYQCLGNTEAKHSIGFCMILLSLYPFESFTFISHAKFYAAYPFKVFLFSFFEYKLEFQTRQSYTRNEKKKRFLSDLIPFILCYTNQLPWPPWHTESRRGGVLSILSRRYNIEPTLDSTKWKMVPQNVNANKTFAQILTEMGRGLRQVHRAAIIFRAPSSNTMIVNMRYIWWQQYSARCLPADREWTAAIKSCVRGE